MGYRILEIFFGFWLMTSPLFFWLFGIETLHSVNNFLSGLAVSVFGFLSAASLSRRAHYLSLPIGLWLILLGYSAGYPSPFAAKNLIIVGLLLSISSIMPNRSSY